MNKTIRKFFDFRSHELSVALLLFTFFFLVIAVFQILKPLKNGLFIEKYGADLELYAKLGNIVVAAVAVAVFSFLYNKMRRHHLIYALSLFFIAAFVLFIYALAEPGPVPIWSFYFLSDLVSTFMVVAFWAYATDLASPDQAKRLFGVAGAGGVIGGWVGITTAKNLLKTIGMEGLLVLSAVLMAGVILVTFLTEWKVRRAADVFRKDTDPKTRDKSQVKGDEKNAAIEGARLVMSSKYLAAIVGIMAFYEIASQVMDYQFKQGTEKLFGETETQAYMANVYFWANSLSVFVQFFLVSFLMKHFSLIVPLLVLPLAITGGSAAFLMAPTLAVASFLVISENGFNYSLQQTARESLYSPTSPDEKYKARAFTNMFVQRFAKGLAIFVVMGLAMFGLNVRYLSLVTIAVVIPWILCSIYAGRRFSEKSEATEQDPKAA